MGTISVDIKGYLFQKTKSGVIQGETEGRKEILKRQLVGQYQIILTHIQNSRKEMG